MALISDYCPDTPYQLEQVWVNVWESMLENPQIQMCHADVSENSKRATEQKKMFFTLYSFTKPKSILNPGTYFQNSHF